MNSIKNRSFNVRISFDSNGEPVIGFCQGFYSVAENIIDIRPVPDSVVLAVAKKLGITQSERLLAVKRKSKSKKIEKISKQMDMLSN